MKFAQILILLFALSLFACKGEEQKFEVDDRIKTAQNKEKVKTVKKAELNKYTIQEGDTYGSAIQRELNLTKAQRTKVVTIQKKHVKNVRELKKAKKWAGAANKKTRTDLVDAKEKEYLDVLGQKNYDEKQIFDQAWLNWKKKK
jgi:uncharacterized protein YdaT